MPLQTLIQRPFTGMTKRRMPNVMHQRQSLGEINIKVESSSDGTRNLRHLHGVRQPRAKVVGVPPRENLCLVFQPAKRARVDDAITIALKGVAVRMGWLRMAASAGIVNADRVTGEHTESLPVQRF